jgi:uncharacterized membrane protein
MMFAVHTRRLQPHSETGLADEALRFCLRVEPYIAASFLFIAGHSLVLARRANVLVVEKLLRRALILYGVAMLLFVPQYGVAFPDLVFSPGILSAIALSVLVVGVLVARDVSDLVLAGVALATLLVAHWLEAPGRSVSGMDAGPGGVIPLLSFTCFGAVLARRWQAHGLRALGVAVALAAPLCFFVWKTGSPWTTTELSRHPAHAGQLALTSLFATSGTRDVPFWNHSALGALGLLFPLVASLAAFVALPRAITGSRWLAPVRALGRHALAAYVGHLIALGVIDLASLGPKGALGTWAIVLLFTLGAILVAWLLDGSSSLAKLARRVYSQP